MDVWLTKCHKTSKCSYCEKPITNGDYMVIGKLWRDREGHKIRFPQKLHFHVDCWVEKGKKYIDNKPYIEKRGRRKLIISDENRESRLRIMRKRAAVVQRINTEVRKSNPNIDKMIHLGELLHQYKEDIENFGGAPKGW